MNLQWWGVLESDIVCVCVCAHISPISQCGAKHRQELVTGPGKLQCMSTHPSAKAHSTTHHTEQALAALRQTTVPPPFLTAQYTVNYRGVDTSPHTHQHTYSFPWRALQVFLLVSGCKGHSRNLKTLPA